MRGFVEPPDPHIAAEYWITRRSSDASPGYDLGLPDLRCRYRWNGNGAWIVGYYNGMRGREAVLSCLPVNNGWRIERMAIEEESAA